MEPLTSNVQPRKGTKMPHDTISIIETRAHAMLAVTNRQVMDCAGLAIVKGPVGVGKTFALDLICNDLEAEGANALRLTSTPTIEGSISAFTKEALRRYSSEVGSTQEGLDQLWRMLSGRPFGQVRRPALLIVDEAQGLKPTVWK